MAMVKAEQREVNQDDVATQPAAATVPQQMNRSTARNKFHDASRRGEVPPCAEKRLEQIDGMGPKSNKRALRTEIIDEYCKKLTFDTPYFKQSAKMFTADEDINEKNA